MFSKLTTAIALRRAGLPTDPLDTFTSSSRSGKQPSQQNELLPFANPFANLSVPKSWHSWAAPVPPPIQIAGEPVVGGRAPTSERLRLPGVDGRATVVCFLRFAGCPFAEKAFLELRRLANKHPQIRFIAISHCTAAATQKWVGLLGGAWAVSVVVDEERTLYAQWGLGVGTSWYLLNPAVAVAARRLGVEEGNWGREVGEGANRWVVGGAWAVDRLGSVRWGGRTWSASEIPELEKGCAALGAS